MSVGSKSVVQSLLFDDSKNVIEILSIGNHGDVWTISSDSIGLWRPQNKQSEREE